MNIKEAKQQIKNTVEAYLTKDEFGYYIIPVESQRPVFLMGPPGVGKTAIMQQISEEIGIGLVSYSMTHHTRQSALGLPYIEKKVYGGEEYSVSEYTMSEIIASVYEKIESTGIKEGILFLDEINCISETLAPAMLQFLQYKVFGKHCVPEGWVVVTAGNPPEYNKSVREFDVATWDRMKRIDVEPFYDVWKEHAYQTQVHPAVMTYLEIKKDVEFYSVESTVDGKTFVTARGWSDLSSMIKLYELKNIKVDYKLISQYIQNKKIAKNFANYYDIFNKYKADYQVERILDGKTDESSKIRISNAQFDEKYTFIGLLIEAFHSPLRSIYYKELLISSLFGHFKNLKETVASGDADVCDELQKFIDGCEEKLKKAKETKLLSKQDREVLLLEIAELERIRGIVSKAENKNDPLAAFEIVKGEFEKLKKDLQGLVAATSKKLTNTFEFCESAFGDGQEMLVFVTELTVHYFAAHFIGKYGCEEYFKYNKSLLLYERHKKIISEIEANDL